MRGIGAVTMNEINSEKLFEAFSGNEYFDEFISIIGELAKRNELKRLHKFTQHMNTSRLEHSVHVAFYSFLISKKLGLDYASAARAGLLHDLFLYDWREKNHSVRKHIFAHPVAALETAAKIVRLNPAERDAIHRHMWPLAKGMPRYAVSYVVSVADKYCTCYEIYRHVKNRVSARSKRSV